MTSGRTPIRSVVATHATTVRNRTSAESRDRLLLAAAELFAEYGYEGTTVRQIGRRAEVDPTLIARYFGSKAALYLEALRRGTPAIDRPPLNLSEPGAVIELLERVRRNGLTPTLYAAIRPLDDEELQSAASEVLKNRVIEPTTMSARRAGLSQPELRAELVTAALAGIVVSRISQALPTLAGASSEELAPLVADLIAHMTSKLDD
jgi:AcrR family transcriptional regulator